MLVEVDSKIEAQRLANVGYDRTGQNSIECSLAELDDVREMDNITVTKIALKRRNSSEEAAVIDSLIDNGYEGSVRAIDRLEGRDRRKINNFGAVLKVRKEKVFQLSADSLTVYRHFDDVLSGDISEHYVDEEEFQQAVVDTHDEIRLSLGEVKEKIQKLRDVRNELENGEDVLDELEIDDIGDINEELVIGGSI